MREATFYTIVIGGMSGVFLRSFFDMHVHMLALLIGIIGWCAWTLIRSKRGSPLFFVAILACSVGVGAWRMDSATDTVSVFAPYAGHEVTLEARIVREPEMREKTLHLYVESVDDMRSGERVLVTLDRLSSDAQALAYGDTLTITGTLKAPESFTTDGGRTFDYPGYLRARDVYYLMSYADVVSHERDASGFMTRVFAYKQQFQEVITTSLTQPSAGLGEGVLLGVRRALGTELEEVFRTTGIIHIVVLSGYNIMIVVTWLTYLLAYIAAPRLRMIVGVLAICTFVLLVGASPTAIRAGIMAALLLIARGTGRTYAVVRALMLAGILMLLAQPFLLVHDTGFQLSFLATLGLILLAPHVERWIIDVPAQFGFRNMLAATIAAQIVVTPLLLYHTGLFSIVSIIVNALVLPVIPVAMLLTFLTGVLGLVSATLGMLVGFAAYVSLAYVILVAEFFAAMPFAAIRVPVFPFGVTLFSYVLMALWIVRLSRTPMTHDAPAATDLSAWTIEEETETPKRDLGVSTTLRSQ
jgi:competence protein ComEC